MGVRPSVWLGEPDTGGWTEPERRLMRALTIAERWDCSRCGGDLRHELTTDPPWDDTGVDHGHRMETTWCRGCVAKIRHDRKVSKRQEEDEGTMFDAYPDAQIVIPRRIPLPGR